MDLNAFLEALAHRARCTLPEAANSIGMILIQVGLRPHVPESTALRKAASAIVAQQGQFTQADLDALGGTARGWLLRFAHERSNGHHPDEDLHCFVANLATWEM